MPSRKPPWSCLDPLIHIYLSIYRSGILYLFPRRSFRFSFSCAFHILPWFFTFFLLCYLFVLINNILTPVFLSIHFLRTWHFLVSFLSGVYIISSNDLGILPLLSSGIRIVLNSSCVRENMNLEIWVSLLRRGSTFDEGEMKTQPHEPLFIQVQYRKSALLQNFSNARELHSSLQSQPEWTKRKSPCRWCSAVLWFSLSFTFCLLSLKVQGDKNALRCVTESPFIF